MHDGQELESAALRNSATEHESFRFLTNMFLFISYSLKFYVRLYSAIWKWLEGADDV